MTTILRTRTGQPQNPTGIDWGNAVSAGLSFSYDWDHNGPYNAVTSTPIRRTGNYNNGVTPVITPYGIGQNEGLNSNDTLTFSTGDISGSTTASVTVWIKNGSITNSNKIILAGSANQSANSSGTTALTVFWKNVGGERELGIYSSWTDATIAIGGIPDGLHTLAWCFGNNLAPIVFLNGRQVGSGAPVAAFYAYRVAITGFFDRTISSIGVGHVLGHRVYRNTYSPVKAQQLSANPWQIFQPEQRMVFVGYDSQSEIIPPVVPAQSVSVGYSSFSSQFYAHSIAVAVGNPNLGVPFLPDSNTWLTHVVQTGTVLLSTTLHTNSNTFYTHSIAAASTALAAPYVTNSSTWYTHLLSRGSVGLSAPYTTSGSSFYTHTAQVGSRVLAAPYYQNSATFYSHVVTSGLMNLVVPYTPSTNSFNAGVVNPGGVSVGTLNYTNNPTFYSHALTPRYTTSTTRLDSTSAFYSHTVAPGSVFLSVPRHNNAQTFYTHSAVTQGVLLTPSRLNNANTFYVLEVVGGTWPYTPSLRFYIPNSKDTTLTPSARSYIFVSGARNTVVSRLLDNPTTLTSGDRSYEFTPEPRNTTVASEPRTTIVFADSRTTQVVSPSRTT